MFIIKTIVPPLSFLVLALMLIVCICLLKKLPVFHGVLTPPHSKVLLFVPMSQKRDLRNGLWSKNLSALTGTDVEVMFCVYDVPEKEASTHLSSIMSVPMHFRYTSGCKAELWRRHLRPWFTCRYEYVWVCDEDIDLTDFKYDKFRKICNKTNALVIQPSVLGFNGGRSTDYTFLRHIENSSVEYKTIHFAEIQCCWIHSVIWDVVYSRLSRMNTRSCWGLDSVWSTAASLAGIPPLLVYHPVLHMDYRSMNNTHARCMRKCVDGCRPLNMKEVKLIEAAKKKLRSMQ